MSWLSDLASKAEDLLNKVDQSAAHALKQEEGSQAGTKLSPHGFNQPQHNHANSGGGYGPYLSSQTETVSPNCAALSSMTASSSVPSNLNKLNTDNGKGSSSYNSQMSRSMYSTSQLSSGKQSPANVQSKKKDKDEELFEFLNSPESLENKRSKSSMAKLSSNGKHSRQSSTSSTTSTRSGKAPDAISQSSSTGINISAPAERTDDTDSVDHSPVAVDMHEDVGNPESSSGYHSNQDSESAAQQQHLSSLELENKLLKNEVASLNHEMTSVIHRAKGAQDELQQVRQKLEQQNRQMSRSDQIVRELQSQEADLQEALRAKDSQLAVLRIRFEEADKDLVRQKQLSENLQQDNQRILQDHTSSSGVQSQALETLKEKLTDAESSFRREKETFQRSQNEANDRLAKLEEEQRNLSDALAKAQKQLNEERDKKVELINQAKLNKGQADGAKQELTEYKEKATRILQSKDKLIASLKEGSSSAEFGSAVSQAELEQLQQEREMLREEVQKLQITLEGLRTEVGDLEVQMQQDSDTAHEQITSLEEQLATEKRHRDDAELEISKQKQELRYAHEELLKQKTGLQSRVQEREQEIERLRSQLTTKTVSTSSEAELENRLHALTESLIQKQTMLEALSTEKNSLVLQLERTEKHYREAEAMAVRASSTAVTMNEDDDGTTRQRLPTFMRESPLDGEVSRRVKRAANSIDKFSIRLGVFLRRYPVARVFVIMYMFLLHLWVMIVLLTYQPEMHGSEYSPQEPH